MAKNQFNEIVDKMVDNDLMDKSLNLSNAELEFLQKNPRLLAKLSDSSFIKKKYIFRLAGISVLMIFISKIVEYTEVLSNYKIANDILTNVQFSVAMEMLGASIIAYFLEITLEKRVQQNQKLVEQILERINKEQV
ncbi:hypothetical protein [Empedobacter sedimenti]|uniref:hypothetical protein n=1 Tax=Empedobacter sedimenti TaxID=3042610 RepID=UPI0024A65F29|nr:hypothetical protein [Empedobacter sedimenti]